MGSVVRAAVIAGADVVLGHLEVGPGDRKHRGAFLWRSDTMRSERKAVSGP
jgi:hypothetical protein